MTRRKLDEENIRSLMKIGSSYAITIPLEFVKKLKWREKQKIEVKMVQDRIVIKDWK
jgi:antitoxin component of MazEF toxin-antitoxin module